MLLAAVSWLSNVADAKLVLIRLFLQGQDKDRVDEEHYKAEIELEVGFFPKRLDASCNH